MRILFLTQRLPYAPNRGDRVRAFHLLRRMREFAEVDLLSLVHDDEEASHVGEARELASSVQVVRVPRARNAVRSFLALPTTRPTTHTMLDAPELRPTIERMVREHPPSLVFAYCSGMARLAFEPPLDRMPFVHDMVDVDSAKWASLATTAWPPRSWVYSREERLLARFEAAAARRAFVTLITTSQERDALQAIAPGTRIDVLENGVDAASLRPQGAPGDAPVVVFCGVMNYAPNEEGALWLAREVWPIVRRHLPEAKLQLVGSHPTKAVQSLATTAGDIVVTGHVADVRPYLWQAAVSVAPLLKARGIQNKVLEAVAAGLPVVVTPVVSNGVPDEIRPACVVADGAVAFAEAVVKLLRLPPTERRAMANRADLNSLSWERRLQPIPALLAAAAEGRSGDPK